MVKGTIAKANVVKKIQESFGADFIGEIDKKIYVWADDEGERVQIALSLTRPSTPVGTVVTANKDGGIDFNKLDTSTVAQTTFEPAEITEEEVETTRLLMEKLGLI